MRGVHWGGCTIRRHGSVPVPPNGGELARDCQGGGDLREGQRKGRGRNGAITRPFYGAPEAMFRGHPHCRPCDMRSAPNNLTVRFGDKATYGGEIALGFLYTEIGQSGI